MGSEERIFTVLFAAVAGSSKLAEKSGGTEAWHAVDRCQKRMARGVDGFRGRLVTSGRDELAALFESADDACQAATAMQRRVADLPPLAGVQLALRVGFHHGPVSVAGAELRGPGARITESLAALANAGQILTSGETRALLSPPLQATSRRLEALAESSQLAKGEVFEIVWNVPQPLARPVVVQPPAPAKERAPRLCIRYGGQVRLLDKNRPHLGMGRDASCEITVRDRRASRQHATIERRGESFVLTDLSTNGTFVTVAGENELFLRCEEFVLRGSGMIAFAASASSPAADIAEFELL